MKTLLRIVLLFFAAAGSLSMMPQASLEIVGSVSRLDPALDAMVAPDAKIEKVAGGFKFTEGPIWFPSGYLLFSDIPNNTIMKWTPDGHVSVFMHPSGYRGERAFKGIESGSNGLTLDPQGRLTIAEHAGRRVTRLEADGTLTVLAERYQGKRLNSPNDLVYAPDGDLYFTDPPYGLETQNDSDPLKELPFNGVYRIAGAVRHKAGAPPEPSSLQPVIRDLTRPNGIAFSPDRKYLYVDNSEPQRLYLRYRVKGDGTLTDRTVFYDATSSPAQGAPDGMKVDEAGNLYATGPGGVWVFSPQGKHLGTIQPPEIPANCNWGDADRRTLYITARTGLYRIRLNIAGARPF